MPVVAGFVPTPEGRAALDSAIAEANLRNAKLVVVAHERRGTDSATLADAVAEAESTLSGTTLEHEVRQSSQGADVAEDLMQVADELGAELIVIGLRRRSPVGKLILGSNAQRVLLDATCPVLAVKPARPA